MLPLPIKNQIHAINWLLSMKHDFGLKSISDLPSASDFKEAIDDDSSDQDSEKFL